MSAYFTIFDCDNCHAELKQNLVRKPKEDAVNESQPNLSCEACAFSDIHCTDCGDPICDQHIRTISKYTKYLSPEAAASLESRYGNHLFCPLCFQAAISRPLANSTVTVPKPNTFRVGIILALSVAFFIIVVSLRNCSATKDLTGQSETTEISQTTAPATSPPIQAPP